MGTRLNRHYNNPAIGAAFDNIASIFAPPSSTDILAYAQAAKARQELQGLEQLYGMADDPNLDTGQFDRLGAITGQWSPSSGFGARDMASADRRYGTDVGAAVTMRGDDIMSGDRRYNTDVGAQTTLATNANTVRGGLIGDLFGPVSEGQIRPSVPDDIMGAVGLPGIDQVTGLPKPKTAEQVEGDMLMEAIGGGMYGPQDAANAARSDINIEEIIGATGDPQIVSRADAIGQQPFVPAGSAPAISFKTWTSPGTGRSGIARIDPGQTGGIRDSATSDPLPPDAILSDSVDTVQGITGGTSSAVQQDARNAMGFMSTVDQLSKLVAESPASQGLVGGLRGTAQNVMSTGSELGQFFGGTVAEVTQAVNGGLADAELAAHFDPSLPAIDMLSNLLAWQYAKSMSGDRVSNQAFESARQAIGTGNIWSSQADTLTRLGQLRSQMSMQMQRDLPMLPPEMQAQITPFINAPAVTPQAMPGAAQARPRATNPSTGQTLEFDGTAWVPVQ